MEQFWGHKSSLSNMNKIKIMSSIFSDHNTIQLEINKKKNKKTGKRQTWETKQHATKQPLDNWIIQRIILKIPRNKWQQNTTMQNLWDTARTVLRGKCIAIQSYLRKEAKVKINTLTLHLNQLEREEQTIHKICRRNHKDLIRNKWNRNEENHRKGQWN